MKTGKALKTVPGAETLAIAAPAGKQGCLVRMKSSWHWKKGSEVQVCGGAWRPTLGFCHYTVKNLGPQTKEQVILS